MVNFRTVMQPQSVETASSVNATLASSGTSTVPTIAPQKANGQSIVGVRIQFTAALTLSANTTLSPGTVGSLVKEVKITQGTNKLMDYNGYSQLIRGVHIYSGTTITDTSLPASTSSPSATDDTGIVPWFFTTAVTPQIQVTANNFSGITNATAGTLTVQVTFYYLSMPVQSDHLIISTASSSVSTGSDISISALFPSNSNSPINAVWMDATADADVTNQSFEVGTNMIVDHLTVSALTDLEEYIPNVWTHIAGFIPCQMPPGQVFNAVGVTSTQSNLLVNFASGVTPTFYLVMAQ